MIENFEGPKTAIEACLDEILEEQKGDDEKKTIKELRVVLIDFNCAQTYDPEVKLIHLKGLPAYQHSFGS
jgi:hypothetical protein